VTADEEDAVLLYTYLENAQKLRWSAYVIEQQPPCAQRCVQTIGMAVRNYFVSDRVQTGTMYIYASSGRCKPSGETVQERKAHKAEMKQLSQAGQETRAPALFTHEARHAGLSPTLLTGMPDAVEVLGGMSKGRCRRRCLTPRTRGMYYRLCCM
jgi:hypothetical protein